MCAEGLLLQYSWGTAAYAVCTACFTLHYTRVATSKASLLLFSVIKSAFRQGCCISKSTCYYFSIYGTFNTTLWHESDWWDHSIKTVSIWQLENISEPSSKTPKSTTSPPPALLCNIKHSTANIRVHLWFYQRN